MSRRERGGFYGSSYLSLTTFRRDGRAVATPVWFAFDDDRIVVWSGAAAGKVKRIRNNSRVIVARCDYKGKIYGPTVEATATLLPVEEGAAADRLLNRKYWYKVPYQAVLSAVRFITRQKSQGAAYIEIRLAWSSS